MITYENAGKFGVLPLDVTVKKGAALFPRIDADKEIEELNAIISKQVEEAQKAQQTSSEQKETEEKSELIDFEQFMKTELLSATITDCEPIKKSKKLLKITVNDGTDTPRQIVSGISEWYSPSDLIGKTVVIVSNLKPAKLCGEISNGMLLACDCPDGSVKVVFLDGIPAGAKLR